MKRIHDQTSSDRQLAPEQADRLLNHILDDLHLEYETGSGRRKRKYRRIAVRRYAVKRAAAAACADRRPLAAGTAGSPRTGPPTS